MFLKSAFFNTFFGQCQKTALEAEKTTLISLTTWGRWCVVWRVEPKPVLLLACNRNIKSFKSFVGEREYWTSAVTAFPHEAIPHAVYDNSFVTSQLLLSEGHAVYKIKKN